MPGTAEVIRGHRRTQGTRDGPGSGRCPPRCAGSDVRRPRRGTHRNHGLVHGAVLAGPGLKGAAGTFVWWLVLTGLWLVLVSSPSALEGVVGAAAALPAAAAARAGLRAVRR